MRTRISRLNPATCPRAHTRAGVYTAKLPSSFCGKLLTRGFSLVEVTMAIGLISFCLLTVVGLLPVGLTTMRQAMDQTAESQIIQRLGAQMLLTQFSELGDNFNGKTFYYDDEGNPKEVKPAAGFQVNTAFGTMQYPGSTNAPAASPLSDNLKALQVDIVKLPAANTTNRFNLPVANSGS